MAHQGAGEIRAEVTVTGVGSGQPTHGANAIRMQVDRVLGNAVSVLPPDAPPNITARPHRVRPRPGRPIPVFDHVDGPVDAPPPAITAAG
jgi:hypothetical protein